MITIKINKELVGAQQNFKLSIDETVGSGAFVGIFGKSGSGKTTLLRILSGLEGDFSGVIQVEKVVWTNTDSEIQLAVKDREIGFVTQESILFPNMNVKDQLTFSKGKKTNQKLLDEVVTIFNIENLLEAYPKYLSGGQKQRICLARAIIQEPKILLLDEPFSALDYEIRKELIDLTRKIAKRYLLTVFLVSHHPSEIIDLVNEVWVLNNGTIIEKGLPKEVLSGYI